MNIDYTTIENLIAQIDAATEANTVSNQMVARVLGYLHHRNILESIKVLDSISELPETPKDKMAAYIVDGHLYVFVGEGGDTLDGRYQDCGELRGPKGDKGDKGDDAVVLDGVNVHDTTDISSFDDVVNPAKTVTSVTTAKAMVGKQESDDLEIQKNIFTHRSGTSNPELGLTNVRLDSSGKHNNINSSGQIISSKASGYSNFRLYQIGVFRKGDIYHRHAVNASSSGSGNARRLCYGWTDVDPSSLEDVDGLQLYDVYDKNNVSEHDITMRCPYETGYLVMFYYSHSTYAWTSTMDLWANDLKDKQDALVFDDTPTKDSANPVTSGGVHSALSLLSVDIHGESALVEEKEGHYLFYNASTKMGRYTNNADYGTFNSCVFDVTTLVGQTLYLSYSKRVNTKTYMIVDDYTAITNSSADISQHILAMGATVSTNVSASAANEFAVTIPLTAAAVREQALTGRVYLIVNLRQDYEQAPVYATKGIIDRLAAIEGDQPTWLADEKKRIIDKITEKMEHEIVVFGFNTDQHIRMSSREIYTLPVLRGLNAMRDMAEDIPFSLICLGGDAPGYGTEDQSQEAVTQEVLEVIRATDTDRCPVVYIAGNHDGFQNAGTEISDGRTLFNAATKRNAVRRQLDGFHPRSTNAWFDDAANKVRFIFVDPWSRCTGPGSSTGMRHAAATAILTEALADSKLENSEWMVLIFCHNVLADGVDGNNYAPASAGSVNHWADEVMPRVNQGVRVVACFNGHAHNAGQGVKDGTLFIRSHTSNKSDISQSWDGITYEHVAKTATETSQDVFVLDKTEGKIYAYQFGAGMDRVFVYGDGNPRIALCHLSGIVTVDGQPASGTLTATHHNTAYSCVLGADGSYDFPHLCPECEWGLSLDTYGGDIEPYAAEEGSFTHNIVL